MISLWRKLGRPGRGALLLALFLSAAAAVAGIALLGLSGWFLTGAAVAGASGAVAAFNHLLPSAGVRGLAVTRVLARYAEQLVGHDATLTISATLRPLLFERQAKSQLGLAALPAAELSAVTDDVEAVEGGFLKVISPTLAVIAALLVAVGWTIAVSLWLAVIIALVAVIVLAALPAAMLAAAERRAVALTASQVSARAEIASAIENAIELDVVGRLAQVMASARDHLADVDEAADRLQHPFRIAGALNLLAGGAAALAVIAWAIIGSADIAIASGAALAILAAFEAAGATTRILDAASRASISADRVSARLHEHAEPAQGNALVSILPLQLAQVRIPVGDDGRAIGPVDLTCLPGDIVELSGRSGAGKSTIVEAIAALRPIADGQLTYAGQRQQDLRTAAVLAHAAVAPQFPSFLPAPLREQLAYGRPDASAEEIMFALRLACIDDVVEQRGWAEASTYSGGERRRLGLARAIIAQPQLLLLDEPFAGLQASLAEELRRNLAEWLGKGARAIIFTAHQSGPEWPSGTFTRVRL